MTTRNQAARKNHVPLIALAFFIIAATIAIDLTHHFLIHGGLLNGWK